jgi:hypothetical protein
MKQHLISVAMVLVILILGACSAPSQQGPSAWLDRPLDGDQVAREPLTIQAHASDADGVSRFEFFVGETLLVIVPGNGGRFADAQAGWVPPAPGGYIIRVRAVDGMGNTGAESFARITVGELAAATTTPTPVPGIITITPTPVPGIITITPTPAPGIITITPTPILPPLPVCPGPPVIASFIANPSTITYGQTITFSWGAITNADDAVIDAIGHIALNGGSWPLEPPPVAATYPTKTTTFTLTAVGCGGTTTKRVTVVVNQAQPPPPQPPVCPGPPVIASFVANPSTITAGQSSTLSWGAVTNATSAVIDPDIGGVPTPGSSTVSPGTTRTYTLTATGCGGTVRKQVTIVVNPAPPPPPPPPPPPKDTTPPSISGAAVNPTMVVKQGPGCPRSSRTTTVTATVTDAGGVNRVIARILGTGEVAMNPVGGNVYQGVLGPFDTTGTLSVLIQAWDNAGNGATAGPVSIQVVACIE